MPHFLTPDPERHVTKDLIRKARAITGQTGAEAGAKIGHTAKAWYAWESGTRRMRRELLDAYLEVNGLGSGFEPGAPSPTRALEKADARNA